MPAKNTIKKYKSDSFFHVYNRGTDKRFVFIDDSDYWKYLDIIKTRLLSKPKDKENPSSTSEDIYGKIELVAFCFMPNHYHLLIRQKTSRSIIKFMRSINVSYSMYFNKKYGRSGILMQNIYKAVEVRSKKQFLTLARYIHRNPNPLGQNNMDIKKYKWSSYKMYIEKSGSTFISKDLLLKYYGGNVDDMCLYTERVGPVEGPTL